MRIQEWLKNVVNNPHYGSHIWWLSENQGLIAIHWKHASYDDYNENDSALFRKWAIDNNRYDPSKNDCPEEQKRWKTNFRCALRSATNIKEGDTRSNTKKGKLPYRIYELLERPDPLKVDQKKRSNRKAAQSKLKASSEKRSYHSRLNKLTTTIKEEPFIPTQSRIVNPRAQRYARKPKTEFEDYKKVIKHEQEEPSNYSCSTDSYGDNLPSTLDEFHDEEREDAGYCSFSDSSSINSQDSGYSPQYDRMNTELSEVPANVPLESVETIFNRPNTCSNQPVTNNYRGECEDNYEMDQENDVYPSGYSEWGTKVVEEHLNDNQSVITQIYAQPSFELTTSYTGYNGDFYPWTSL